MKNLKSRNEKIRKTANQINLAGAVVLTVCALFASYQYLIQHALSRDVMNVVFFGLLSFMLFSGASSLTKGFEQKVQPKLKPAGAASREGSREVSRKAGSRFLFSKDVEQTPAPNPFLPG
ncbi:MAG: hypothetical protein RIR18_477 [Pseudomonadota bacterium]